MYYVHCKEFTIIATGSCQVIFVVKTCATVYRRSVVIVLARQPRNGGKSRFHPSCSKRYNGVRLTCFELPLQRPLKKITGVVLEKRFPLTSPPTEPLMAPTWPLRFYSFRTKSTPVCMFIFEYSVPPLFQNDRYKSLIIVSMIKYSYILKSAFVVDVVILYDV